MPRVFDAENWDLTADQHLDRAGELLEVQPIAGGMINDWMEKQALAARHSALAIFKFTSEAISGISIRSDILTPMQQKGPADEENLERPTR